MEATSRSIESHLRDIQQWIAKNLPNSIDTLQNISWKGFEASLEPIVHGKSEASFALLVLDYLLFRAKKPYVTSTSVFGKVLVFTNGYNLISFALQDKSEVWKKLAGMDLKGNSEAEALGSLVLAVVGLIGGVGCVAGLLGPDKHPLSVINLAVTKLIIGFFLVNRTAMKHDKGATQSVLEMARHHARTGAVMLLFSILLVWRGRGHHQAPKYHTEFEKRLSDRLDQLTATLKDQKSRIDSMNPSTSTPKKY